MSYRKALGSYAKLAVKNFLVFVAVFFALQYIGWQVFPYKTANVEVPIEVVNVDNQVTPGGILELHILFAKFTDVTPTISRNILCTDNRVVSVTPTQQRSGLPQGAGQSASSFYKVGMNAQVGDECYFEFQNDYKVNPVRTITKKWQSEPFTIID